MKILAFILVIISIFKIITSINLLQSDLNSLLSSFGIDPEIIYKQFRLILAADGLIGGMCGTYIIVFI